MIISHQYEYLFIEIPHTASTAVSHELLNYYDGKPILYKHAHYKQFLRQAESREEKYLTIAGVRNPLDVAVTRYFKRRTDHKGFFTNPKYWRENGGHVSKKSRSEYRFISENEADFCTYFRKFYNLPYDNWGSPSPNDIDIILHFENLQEDFSALLNQLGINQIRPIPLLNKTSDKESDFLDYYPPEIQNQAQWVFGPFCKLWGYHFPDDWAINRISLTSQFLFSILRVVRKRTRR
jgi:hypothetical protein